MPLPVTQEEFVERVRAFQLEMGLVVDGVVGPKTWAAIKSHSDGLDWFPQRPLSFGALPPVKSRLLFGDPLAGAKVNADGTFAPSKEWRVQSLAGLEIKWLPGAEVVRGMPNVVHFHRRVMPRFKALWSAWHQEGLLKHIDSWAGSLAYRVTRRAGSTRLSQHAYGAAFDINAPFNALGKVPRMPFRSGSVIPLVSTAQRLGWYWGGWFDDGMHFEASLVDAPTDEELEPPGSGE